MIKLILIILAVIAGLAGVVALIGLFVPKGHIAARTAEFKTDSETIWATITDFAAIPSWQPAVKEMKRRPDQNGNPVWVQITRQGSMPMEVIAFEPPGRMVLKIADDSLPFGGSWTYEVVAVEGGTQITITENGEIYNPIFRFMARFIFGYHATMETYLKDLGRKLGEQTEFIR